MLRFLCFCSGIMRLDARARQDVAILGSGFLKLDGKIWFSFRLTYNIFQYMFLMPCAVYYVARAREDTEKIDRDVKRKAERLHHIATVCLSSLSYMNICPPLAMFSFFLVFRILIMAIDIKKHSSI